MAVNNHVLKYYHIDHKGKWLCVPEDQIPPEAKYESVLYIKYRAEDVEASGEEQEYWGPFYIDIDVNEDDEKSSIAIALADIRDIINYFKREFQITDDDYRVYASGGKGFHFELNPYLFMDGKFKPMLPLRYRALASRIKEVAGLDLHIDMGVYSTGKGRQWRRVNVQRENGRYKVWLPRLDGLDVEQIIKLTENPGPVPPKFDKVQPNPLLQSWFSSTKKIADMSRISEPVPTEKIASTDTPECVKKLAENRDVKSNVNSNLLAMQAISYGIARGWNIDTILSYNRNFINTYRSSQYKTPAAFEDHFKALYDYAQERPDKFKFGCKMMLSCVGDVDCNSCEIKIGPDAEESYENVYIKDGCYYLIPDNPDLPHKRLTNFTVKWTKSVKKEIGETRLVFEVVHPGSPHHGDLIETGVDFFASRANLTKLLSMYEIFEGSDKEAQVLKLAIAHMNNPTDISEVGYTGLVWQNDEWHYVTKEGSISLNNTIDLIKANVDISVANETRLNFSTEAPRADEIIRVFDAMSDINKPVVIMPMMTWFINAFFNPHAQFQNETSPSLFVTGLHGSGKTQTMIQLHRLFAPNKPAFPSISATTAFSMNKYASATNLMPLIFDEFKPSANKGRNNEEGQVSQAIRASYNKAFESRGTKDRGIDQTPFYAPLAIIGEQQLNEGAISDRIILVQMDKTFHTSESTFALETLKELPVEKVGALFLEFAMGVRPKEYMDTVIRHDKELEERFGTLFDNRPRRNVANLMAAMDYLEQFILLYTGDEKLVDKLQAKMTNFIDSFELEANEVYNEIRNLDDIANALIQLNDLADLMDTSLGDMVLMPNRHYAVQKGILYLDIYACYRSLQQYVKKFGIDLYLTDRSSFVGQLNHKDYVVKKAVKSDIIMPTKMRLVVGIDIEAAEDNKIILDNFKGV